MPKQDKREIPINDMNAPMKLLNIPVCPQPLRESSKAPAQSSNHAPVQSSSKALTQGSSKKRKNSSGFKTVLIFLILSLLAYMMIFQEETLMNTYNAIRSKANLVWDKLLEIPNFAKTLKIQDIKDSVVQELNSKVEVLRKPEQKEKELTISMPGSDSTLPVLGIYKGKLDTLGRPHDSSGSFLVKNELGEYELYTGEWVNGKAKGEGFYKKYKDGKYRLFKGSFEDNHFKLGIALSKNSAAQGIFKDNELYSGEQYVYKSSGDFWIKFIIENGVAGKVLIDVDQPKYYLEPNFKDFN